MNAVLRPCLAIGFGLLPVTAALAQDRPNWDAFKVQPLQACPGFGTRLPGSDTCIRFSGQVRAEATTRIGGGGRTAEQMLSHNTVTNGGVVTTLNVDARTPTALGDVRTYASIRVAKEPPPVMVGR